MAKRTNDAGTAPAAVPTLPPPAADVVVDDGNESEEVLARMKGCYARLRKEHRLVPGQLVQWKRGLRNRRHPAYGEPAIVMEVLDPPLRDTKSESGNPFFREPITVALGVIPQEGGDLLIFHYDGRRFKPFERDPSATTD